MTDINDYILPIVGAVLVVGMFLPSILSYRAYQKAVEAGMPAWRVKKYWRTSLAKSWYKLQMLGGGGCYQDTGYSGNFKWAKRTATHYECKIVTGDEE